MRKHWRNWRVLRQVGKLPICQPSQRQRSWELLTGWTPGWHSLDNLSGPEPLGSLWTESGESLGDGCVNCTATLSTPVHTSAHQYMYTYTSTGTIVL